MNRSPDIIEITTRARKLGLDLIGFAPVARVERRLEPEHHPSRLGRHFRTVVVVAKKGYAGLAAARHRGTAQFWGGRILKRVEEACLELAEHLERLGATAFPVSALAVDFGEREALDVCPAGQGSPLLKAAAVEAGLGTLGLNLMLLTPQFGPRIHLGGVLTEAEIEPGRPLQEELCLGLEECGRCAAVCPEDAIPRRSRRGAPLDQIRDLNAVACARSSQPLGPRAFKEHLIQILGKRDSPGQLWEQLGGRRTGAFWQEMIMIKEGAFTGCSACLNACPVGRDYEKIRDRLEAAFPDFAKSITGGDVEVENVGCGVNRQ